MRKVCQILADNWTLGARQQKYGLVSSSTYVIGDIEVFTDEYHDVDIVWGA